MDSDLRRWYEEGPVSENPADRPDVGDFGYFSGEVHGGQLIATSPSSGTFPPPCKKPRVGETSATEVPPEIGMEVQETPAARGVELRDLEEHLSGESPEVCAQVLGLVRGLSGAPRFRVSVVRVAGREGGELGRVFWEPIVRIERLPAQP